MKNLLIAFIWLYLITCFSCISTSKTSSVADAIKNSKSLVVLKDSSLSSDIKVERKWNGNNCKISITNNASSKLSIKEVVLFSADKLFAGSTPIHAEGFQLLAQTGGTLKRPKDLGFFSATKQ